MGPLRPLLCFPEGAKILTEKPFDLGLLGTVALLSALLIFLWLLTFEDPDLFPSLVTASFFLVGGLALSFVMVGVRWQPFTPTAFINTILSMVLNVVVILYVNHVAPISFEFAVVDPQLFAVLIGVAEECFFRLFLCGFFFRLTKSFLLAVAGSSAIWTGYHLARYGANFNLLMVIFVCGCVLGATFLYTRSADGSIFAHGVVNYVALA